MSSRKLKRVSIDKHKDPVLATFDVSEVEKNEWNVEHGSFGSVRSGIYCEKLVAVKEISRKCWDEVGKNYVKEARLMHDLDSKYVAKFIAVCYEPLRIMMEYTSFSFDGLRPGSNLDVTNVEDFLRIHNKDFQFQTIEFLFNKIAKDVTSGMAYLHSKGIALRHLKPRNVLLSNQHYIHIKDDIEKAEVIKNEPLIAKITNFGEPRSSIIQYKRSCRRIPHDCRLRATHAFYPPEPTNSTAHLIQGDIWALGMLFFSLINPDLGMPFLFEIEEQQTTSRIENEMICNVHNSGKLPRMSKVYERTRAMHWGTLNCVYYDCASYNINGRPTAANVLHALEQDDAKVAHLQVSQATVFPDLDVFLGLKICIELYSTPATSVNIICDVANDVIRTYLETVTPHLHKKQDPYEPWEALKLMENFDFSIGNYKLKECFDPLNTCSAFSTEGMYELYSAVKSFKGFPDGKLFLYVCKQYTFVIGYVNSTCFVVDVEPVPEKLGGDGNNGVVVFTDSHYDDTLAICKWLWKRLSNIEEMVPQHQLYEVMLEFIVDTVDLDSSDFSSNSLSETGAVKSDIFLSHEWGLDVHDRSNCVRVATINNALHSLGYRTWFDSGCLQGDILKQMADGVDNSQAVIVFNTKKYQEKVDSLDQGDHCCFQFNHSLNTKRDRILILNMENDMKDITNWKESFSTYLDGNRTVDMDDELHLTYLNQKLKHINRLLEAMGVVPRMDVDNMDEEDIGSQGPTEESMIDCTPNFDRLRIEEPGLRNIDNDQNTYVENKYRILDVAAVPPLHPYVDLEYLLY